MAKSRGAAFDFTCPECFVTLKGWSSQVGSHQTCPSCSATIKVPPAPRQAHGPSRREPTLPAPGDRVVEEYGIVEDATAARAADDGFTVICPVCQARIHAAWDEVGQTTVCPDCDTSVAVTSPDSARARTAPLEIDEEKVGQYGIVGETPPTAHARQHAEDFPVYCALCRTLMYATASQVGHKLTCPDCQTQTVVPSPPKKHGPVDVTSQSHGEYGVGGQQQPAAAAAGRGVVAVVCSLCGTRMHARAIHVGRKIKCPDCGTATVISIPKETKAFKPDDTLGEYAVREEPTGAVPTPAPPQEISVVCPLCQTRMMAAKDHVGQIMECPDCGSTVPVPKARPASPPAEDIDAKGDGGEYGIGAPIDTAQRQPPKTHQRAWQRDETAQAMEDLDASRTGWTIPDMYDKFGFLGEPRALVRWVGLSVALTTIHGLLALGIIMASTAGGGPSAALILFSSLGLISVCSILFLFWFAVVSVFCLSIIEDSAAGNERIESWPDDEWSGWILDSFYVVFSMTAASIFAWLVGWIPGTGPWVGPIVVFCLFPVLLLSTLEQGSMFGLVSGPIWSSLRLAFWSWLWFYLRAALLLGLVVIAQLAAGHLLGLFALAPLAVLYVAAMFIYARWLGRLAAHCREVMTVEEDEE